MPSPYAPYSSLESLLAAANVPLEDAGVHSIEALLDMAKRNQPTPAPPVAQRGRNPLKTVQLDASKANYVTHTGKPVFHVRSLRLPLDLLQSVDKLARKKGTNFNAVAVAELRAWLDSHQEKT